MRRTLLRLSIVLAVFVGALTPGQLQAAGTIQPGDAITTGDKGCTLGFAATGGSATYFLTAAHCVNRIGDDVRDENRSHFGDVVAIGNPNVAEADWALIRVRSAYVSRVRGQVRGVRGAPSGITSPNEVAVGDVLRFSGHGIPFYIDPILRENRNGVVVTDDNEFYTAIGTDSWGDSGGPIVHEKSKQAFGLVSRLCVGACTSEGPTIQGVFAKAAAKGFSLKLKRS